VLLPGSKCEEIIRLSGGKLQVLYGLGGVAMMDGLAHGATGMMPGAALVEVYAEIFRRYGVGQVDGARALHHRLLPYLIFALQHLELAVGIEKRVLCRRGVFPSERLREPTLHLDDGYQKQMDALVEDVIGLADGVKATAMAGA